MQNTSLSRLFVGVGIILFGVAALLGSLDIINFGELFNTYWPVLLIGAGIAMLIANTYENYIWSIVLLVAGSFALFNNLELVDINFWQLFWPFVIIAFGLAIITQRTKIASGSSGQITSLLSGFDSKNNSTNYQGDKITAVMGGGTLDLRKATIKKEATIETLAVMGGITLQVPENWDVRVSVMPILGGVENKAASDQKDSAPVLNVVGTLLMGGIEIKN